MLFAAINDHECIAFTSMHSDEQKYEVVAFLTQGWVRVR